MCFISDCIISDKPHLVLGQEERVKPVAHVRDAPLRKTLRSELLLNGACNVVSVNTFLLFLFSLLILRVQFIAPNIFSYSMHSPAANPCTGADSRMPLADLRAPPVYCACNKQSLVRIFQITYPRFVSRSRPGSAH